MYVKDRFVSYEKLGDNGQKILVKCLQGRITLTALLLLKLKLTVGRTHMFHMLLYDINKNSTH